MAESRFIVGIDLGTTHTVVAYVDNDKNDGIKLFDIDQLGYTDARLQPHGEMTPEQTEIWTKAIGTRR